MKRFIVSSVLLIVAGCLLVLFTPQLNSTASPPAASTATPNASTQSPAKTGKIAGTVTDLEGNPIENALVRVKLTEITATTTTDGLFTLTGITATHSLSITAWATGYYVGATSGKIGDQNATILVKPHFTTDNTDYDWFSFDGVEGSASCQLCHPSYEEWAADAHSQSAINPRFLTMYTGADVDGNKIPAYRDLKGNVIIPDADAPYYGPGYKTDYPDRQGNCASCHTPLASKLEPSNTCGWSGCHTNVTAQNSDHVPHGVSPTNLSGNAADGIGCDFCHKIGDVYLDPETLLPYANKPGISSMRLYRPEEGSELFFGTFDDVPRRVSYLPLQEESAFCAPCHYGVFGGVVGNDEVVGGEVVYNSYGEWLESPYSDPEIGQTCQDCHMPPVDYNYFVYPETGGEIRDPNRIHNHLMPGINDVELMQNAVSMTTAAERSGNSVVANIDITNDNTGHHIPTGTPIRHMMLVVTAVDAAGNAITLQNGPTLPDWTGNYAGEAGRYYAKILKDKWTGETPTGAYWRDIELVEDTRLAAFATDTSRYTFAAPVEGTVTITAKLVFRKAFQKLMDEKGWDDPDLIIKEETIILR